jgi:signal transduction histidine kinase
MDVLSYRPEALDELASCRANLIEELDFATGNFNLVYGRPVSGLAATDLAPFHLTGEFVVGRFVPNPRAMTDNRFLAQSLSLLYQRNWTSLLLETTLRPLNFELYDQAYYVEIANRTVSAMRGRYSIIRLYSDDDNRRGVLKCAAVVDTAGSLADDLQLYDMADDSPNRDIYRKIEEAFYKKSEYIHVLTRTENLKAFSAMTMKGSETIQTIVISPLTVGNVVKGFINIGYDLKVGLNQYMSSTFATMLNHMSIAIENFQKLNEISDLRRMQLRDYIERFHLDLLQGFRHTGHNALFAADGARQQMMRYYTYKGDPKKDPASALESAHHEIELAFENMASLREFSEKRSEADLVELFEGAKVLLERQIENAGVTIRVNKLSSGGIRAVVNGDAIRSAFANLLLNSIQAFVGFNTKRVDRKVTVNFRKERGVITIDFVDDGPGIRVPAGGIREIRDIWVPGKTSKERGTGYGLPMVREVFQHLHRGSIDLRSSTRGAHFRIVLRDGAEGTSAH